MTIAYSYIRFSTPIQKLGRSYERQMEACIAWCAKKGIELSDKTFFDDGRSGYSGDHIGERGQLKRFLDLVEAKEIAKGSYLVIESLDRLSRQSVNEALPLFMRILNADIQIVTLMDNEKVYTKDFTPQDLIMSVFVMARANEESATKSKRAQDDWKNKFAKARESKKPVGRQVAKWLELVDGEYKENPERCAVVRRVFRLCIEGRGFVAISQGLNNDGVPAFRGGTWCSSSVDDLLKNRCVLGEWTPKDGNGVIEEYFPEVIDATTWNLAQLAMEERRGGNVTRQSKNFQVWQGVARCSICLSTMNSVAKGDGYKYLACSGKRKGMCKALNVRLDASETVFKELLVKVGALGLIETDSANLEQEIQTMDALLLHQRQILQRHIVRAD